jgi:spore coat polysaccharide biosynthesis predicted glycosyltransferase SpsG
MRCLALAEEFIARGSDVRFCGDVGSVPWCARRLAERGIEWMPPPTDPQTYVDVAGAVAASLVVVDSYVLPVDVYASLRGAGYPVLAIVDGDPGGREADIYVDQNIGAELHAFPLPPGSTRLAGLQYALMRDEVLDAGPLHRPAASGGVAKVFAFFGGTDAFGAAPVMARLLLDAADEVDGTFVAAGEGTAEQLARIATGPGQRILAIPPTDRLVEHIRSADLVLSAAGTSTWELMCLGVPTGLIRVADNQVPGYHRVVDAGAAVGLGSLEELTTSGVARSAAVRGLRSALYDSEVRERLRAAARGQVDGHGRVRVVDAALRLFALDPLV